MGKVENKIQTQKKPLIKRKNIVVGLIIISFHILGFLSSINALMSSRTAPGTVAWIVSLNTFPYVAVPAYWLFGSPKFRGEITDMREKDSVLRAVLQEKQVSVTPYIFEGRDKFEIIPALEKLARMPFLKNNEVELLIDGKDTYKSIFEGIDSAEKYLLVQFYIVKDDSIGRELKNKLIKKAEEGIKVLFMYDAIGSHSLPSSFLNELESAGVKTCRFRSGRGWVFSYQINFRNHRKIVIADGEKGWIGGLNVADEYLKENSRTGKWRDTHLALRGPAVLALQISFVEDWYWIKNEVPELDWMPVSSCRSDIPVLVIPSGPTDKFETASLLIQHILNSAKERVWISSPYFVPDEGVMKALKLAAFRGVDVRILIPEKPDHILVYYAAYAFVSSILDADIKVYRYHEGFLHGKSFLVDSSIVGVGTVNLDNRSFRLNFEITAVVLDSSFAKQTEKVFKDDFVRSRIMEKNDAENQPLWFKIISRAAYMTAPLL